MKEKGLVVFTKVLLDIMFFSGILVCAALPWIFRILGNYFYKYRIYYLPMSIICFAAGILALWIIRQLKHMIVTVIEENCFITENVTCLRKMGIASFIISLLFLISLAIQISVAIGVIIIVFFVAGLFSLVLAQVFHQAVIFKEENDLTI